MLYVCIMGKKLKEKLLYALPKKNPRLKYFMYTTLPGRSLVHYTVYLKYFLDICVGKCVHNKLIRLMRRGGMMSGGNSECATLYLAIKFEDFLREI